MKSLFNVNHVDLVSDGAECISFFEKRLTKTCCRNPYKIMLLNYDLKNSRELMDKCRELTKKRSEAESCAMIGLCSAT